MLEGLLQVRVRESRDVLTFVIEILESACRGRRGLWVGFFCVYDVPRCLGDVCVVCVTHDVCVF